MYSYTVREKWGFLVKETRVNVTKCLDGHPRAHAGIIIHDDGQKDLISNMTLVCTVDKDGWLTCRGSYSQATRKHISLFMRELASYLNYYDAKFCYEHDKALNIYTRKRINLSEYAKMQG